MSSLGGEGIGSENGGGIVILSPKLACCHPYAKSLWCLMQTLFVSLSLSLSLSLLHISLALSSLYFFFILSLVERRSCPLSQRRKATCRHRSSHGLIDLVELTSICLVNKPQSIDSLNNLASLCQSPPPKVSIQLLALARLSSLVWLPIGVGSIWIRSISP